MSAFGTTKNPKKFGSERSDDYESVVCIINDRWRVIACKHDAQWILQKSKAEGGPARAWHGVVYFEALIEACARLCWFNDPEAKAKLHGLPERFAVNRGDAS